MIADDFITAPAIVVGGGIAGLSAALALESCIVVAGEPIGGGASQLAQSGIAAACAPDDSPVLHVADTLGVSAGIADPEIAALVAEAALGRITWLAALGVTFDRSVAGNFALGREAGHGRHRVVHAGGDRSGAAIMRALRTSVHERPDIQVLEGFELLDLVTCGNRAAGILVESPTGMRLALLAPHVVFATGGIGSCFERTTNPPTSCGAGLAAAARGGVTCADLEFVQFHPTALADDCDPLPLLTEALRGAGAVLLDESGRRFMADAHPHADLAPRDIVARCVHSLRAKGRCVFLDATRVADLATRFPGACEIARAAGLDPTTIPLPITTAAHFHMGGIATDAWGATSMKGLWACGEVAATGLHGGNRLASNSLVEGLVFGERVARAIRSMPLAAPKGNLQVPHREIGPECLPGVIATLRNIIDSSLGPLRSGDTILAALKRLEGWPIAGRAVDDLVTVGLLLATAALKRRESRGAHQRKDYPNAGPIAARSFLTPDSAPLDTLRLLRTRVA